MNTTTEENIKFFDMFARRLQEKIGDVPAFFAFGGMVAGMFFGMTVMVFVKRFAPSSVANLAPAKPQAN